LSVSVTDHAFRRWHQRSDCPALDPAVAWVQAIEFECPTLEGDEIRYHEDSNTCLVRKDSDLVTVIDVSEAPWETRQAVAAINGGDQR